MLQPFLTIFFKGQKKLKTSGSKLRVTSKLSFLKPIISLLCLLFFLPELVFAQKLSPAKTYDLFMTKGLLHFSSLEFEEAIEDLTKAREAKPENAEVNYYLGASYNQIGKYELSEPLLRKAIQLNPKLNEQLYYEHGLSYFFMGKYAEAIKEFSLAENREKDNALVYYYKALSYYKMENFERSIPLFLRAVLTDKNLALNCNYYSGVAYYKRGLFEEAKDEFEATLKIASPDSEIARSAENFLKEMEKLDQQAAAKRWAFNLGVTIQDDDNVTLESKETIPELTTLNKEDSRSILFLQTELNFLKFSKFKSSLRYVFYQSMHTSLSQFNVQDQTASLIAAYNFNQRNQFQLTYSYDYILLEKDKYGTINSLSPLWIIQETPAFYTQLLYTYQRKDYQDTPRIINNQARGGTNNLAGISQFWIFLNDRANFRMGYNYDLEQAKEKSWDYSGHKFFSGILLPVRKAVRLDLGAEYYSRSYKVVHYLFNRKRQDDILSWTAMFLVDEGGRDELSIQYLYTDNRSNIASYRFIRNLYSFTWTKRF